MPAVEISPRLSHSCIRRAETSQLISIYCLCVSVCARVFSASMMQSSVACGDVLFAPPHTIFHLYSSPSITVRKQTPVSIISPLGSDSLCQHLSRFCSAGKFCPRQDFLFQSESPPGKRSGNATGSGRRSTAAMVKGLYHSRGLSQ